MLVVFLTWCAQDSAPSAEELARTAAATNQTEAASSEIRSAESVRPVESDSEGGDDDHLDSNESDIDDTELSDNTGGLPSKRVERGTVLSTRRRRTPAVYGDAGLDSLSDSDHSDSDERSQPRRANSHGTNKWVDAFLLQCDFLVCLRVAGHEPSFGFKQL